MRWCRRWGRKSTAFLYPNKEANSHALLLFFWLQETSMPPSAAERFHRTARCSWNISNSPPSIETNQSAVQPVPLKVYFTCTSEIKQTIWAPEERILWVGSGRTGSIKTRLAVSCFASTCCATKCLLCWSAPWQNTGPWSAAPQLVWRLTSPCASVKALLV